MIRFMVSLVVAVALLAVAWNEGMRLQAWRMSRAADRAYYAADLDGALERYETVRRLLPDYPFSHADLAGTVGQALEGTPGQEMTLDEFEQETGRALRAHIESIRRGPPGAWAYSRLGDLVGALRSARTRDQEVDLSSLSVDPLERIGPEDRFHEAALVKAVQLEPRNYYYRDFLGQFYLSRGFEERALAHFRVAARLHPVLDRHYYVSQLALVSPAVLSAVETGIREALQSEETVVPRHKIHVLLASLYARVGRFEDARASLLEAAELLPDPYVIDARIGTIFVQEGDDEAALEAFRRATEREPGYHRAWRQSGLTLSRLGRHDEAVEAARRARSLRPTDFSAAFSLASVLRRAGRLDEAAEVLENLTQTHADEQRSYLQLIEIHEKQGNLSRAVQAARRLAARYPEEPVFQEQLEQLEQARGARP